MTDALKTGVVGAGIFGGFHAGKLAANPRSTFLGVFDPDTARAAALAERFDAAVFSSAESLVDSVDAVIIASPAPTHFDLARRALESGRHVYVEKPVAMTTREADRLVAMAEASSLKLQVGHQERFVLAALSLPGEDAPERMEFSRCGPPSGRCEDVSVALDLMIHDLDIARMFGFDEPHHVAASGDYHEAVATFEFNGGRSCSFIASRRAEERRRQMSVFYADRTIEIDFIDRRITTKSDGAPVIEEFSTRPHPALADALGESVDAFIASILDRKPCIVDGRAGRRALAWALTVDRVVEETAALRADNRMIA
ncbi:MAG: Gfo/Idh/MocA family oxidoreductase [Parvularculaceae bacterium]